jgi:hypothetical protein
MPAINLKTTNYKGFPIKFLAKDIFSDFLPKCRFLYKKLFKQPKKKNIRILTKEEIIHLQERYGAKWKLYEHLIPLIP